MVETLAEPRIDDLRKVEDKKAVLLLSGGIDSTTLLYDLISQNYEVRPISFMYGQKHSQEVTFALATCYKLGLLLDMIELDALGQIAPSALTRITIEVPKAGYDEENMRQTVVPNRNMVFLALATSFAIGLGINKVFFAAHGGDHALYPDCRPSFLLTLAKAIKLCDYKRVDLEFPYLYWTKEDIVRKGEELGVDYSLTWSCYVGLPLACGKCGTCIERLEAFRKAGVTDPLEYKEV